MNATNPLSLLKNDHANVKSMLRDYKKMSFDDKKDQAEMICSELVIHMGLEEEHFYPEVKDVSSEGKDMVSEAMREHKRIREHVRKIGKAAHEKEVDEHLQELEAVLLDHISEEEKEMFPFAERNFKDDFNKIEAKFIAYKAANKGKSMLQKIKDMI